MKGSWRVILVDSSNQTHRAKIVRSVIPGEICEKCLAQPAKISCLLARKSPQVANFTVGIHEFWIYNEEQDKNQWFYQLVSNWDDSSTINLTLQHIWYHTLQMPEPAKTFHCRLAGAVQVALAELSAAYQIHSTTHDQWEMPSYKEPFTFPYIILNISLSIYVYMYGHFPSSICGWPVNWHYVFPILSGYRCKWICCTSGRFICCTIGCFSNTVNFHANKPCIFKGIPSSTSPSLRSVMLIQITIYLILYPVIPSLLSFLNWGIILIKPSMI